METNPKGPDTSTWDNVTPNGWPKDWSSDTVNWPKPTWGKPKAEENKGTKSRWWKNDEDHRAETRENKTTSPSNLGYRFTNCQICDQPLGTRVHHNGPLTCFQCRKWISEDNFEANETTVQAGDTTTADTNETQISEESDTDETLATSAPRTPPRNFRQAATYVLSKLQW